MFNKIKLNYIFIFNCILYLIVIFIFNCIFYFFKKEFKYIVCYIINGF